MSIRLYADEFRCAIYEEAPGGGNPEDPNSLMNRPVLNPMGWLDNVYFHSSFDYYGAVFYNPAVAISHAAVAGLTSQVTRQVSVEGQRAYGDHLLIQHNLGYVPRFFAVYNGLLVPHGLPVQDQGSGRKRFVTAYATTTQIRLWEVGWSSTLNLDAVNLNYGVIVFANSEANPLLDQLRIEPGTVVFGRGRFNLAWPHLRAVAAGDSPLSVPMGRTAAVGNGSLRVFGADGVPRDFGPYVDRSGLVAPPSISVAVGRG